MDRQRLVEESEAFLRQLIQGHVPPETAVYLFGSRARGDARWNSDFDLWIDGDFIAPATLARIQEALEESFVPFHVDIITSRQLTERFGEAVRQEAKRWM